MSLCDLKACRDTLKLMYKLLQAFNLALNVP